MPTATGSVSGPKGLSRSRIGKRPRSRCGNSSPTSTISYIHELINRKRSAPAEDVISDLVAAQPEWGYDDGYIARLGAGLLFAGHETTVARIDFGTLLLTTHPEQRAALARDPELIPRAVDEILRMATPSDDDQLLRYANADIDIAGVRIKAGDAVLIALTAGNRDPEMFPDPDSFDVTRPNNGHLAFGHGAHYCIGASLARVELHEVFGALLQRMPTLRLATPLDQLELRTDVLTGGLVSLPVTW
jgi:cytochrome P450